MEAVLILKRQLKKFYNVVSIGLLFFMMLMFFVLCVRGVNPWVAFERGT